MPPRVRPPTVPTLTLLAFGLAAPGVAAPAAAQVADFVPEPVREQPFELSIRTIMEGPAHVGQSPSSVRWTDDGRWIYFRWRPGGGEWDDAAELHRVPAEGGDPERIPEEEDDDELAARLARGSVAPDGRWKVVEVDGDLWRVDRASQEVTRLTDTRTDESDPRVTPDGSRILFEQGGDVFAMDVDGAGVVQLTDIRSGRSPEDREAEGQDAFLEAQQEELFEHVRRREERRREREAERDAEQAGEPEPLYIPEGERLVGLTPSPDGSRVLVSTVTPARGGRRTMVPEWVTESGYTEPMEVRTKVGEEPGSGRVGLLEVASGEVVWLDGTPEGFEGEVRTGAGPWNDAGTHALITARSDDDENAWIHVLDAATGELTLVDHLHDEAWLGGPCSWGCMGWIPGSDRLYWASEETGYSHLYAAAADGTGKRALTSGAWEVLDVEIPEGSDRFLVTTHERSPFDQHVGWLDFDGGPVEYLTDGDGRYEVAVSPDGERLAVLHDVANRPPELFVSDASGTAGMEPVTVTPTAEWLSFPWLHPEIVEIPAEDGARVPARIYRPSDVGAAPNGAGVIFVHGAGYLHNVHDYWSSYYREYQFHHLLAARGYTVLDIDYRGSAGYGRDWRTAIYRWMGGKDLSDQVDGARWLVAEEGIDPDRIGIYGGSYGGFITLMALFTAGDTFKAGAALRSVTDWAHYNEGYTSNILNDPQEDEEAYRRSSPIYFAEGLRPDQHLLILHGMVDTNVHFSDVVRLAQRLIELGKENWEMALYPVEGHGFVEPSSWTDEYRRIFELFERTISRPGCTEGGALCPVPQADAAATDGAG